MKQLFDRSWIARFSWIAVVVGAVAVTMAPGDAAARPRPAGRASNFEANKTFGLGLMLGAPTGLSGKYFLGSSTALDFGVGVIRYYRHRDSNVHIHADFLWHPVSLASTPPFELPLYFGIGGRIWDFDDDDDDDDDGFGLGVRAPIGIAMDFNRVPLDVFFELALVVDLFFDDDEDYGADVNGAIGLRYYFN